MRFSVLLPTRNGGPFLDKCIRSVLNQAGDIELIVSDNANSDETPLILEQWRHDNRVKILRLDTPVSVTDNWNNALHHACGDYLLMMGDDDYLLPEYFIRMETLLSRYENPDCILYNGYSFVAPGSIGGDRQCYYSEWHFPYGNELNREMVLNREFRRSLVHDMFRFKVGIPLNMQTALVRREIALRVPKGLFRPPFPDHYALNSLLLMAPNWVFVPERLIVVGVSPKSFGHFIYSNKPDSGLAYLGIKADFPGRLPGNELLNGMYVWLNMLKEAFPDELRGVDVDRGGYVRRQVYAWLMQWKLGAITMGAVVSNLTRIVGRDWVGVFASLIDKKSWERVFLMLHKSGKSDIEQQWNGLVPLPKVGHIAEFAQWIVSKNTKG